jgi:hypothetical protein
LGAWSVTKAYRMAEAVKRVVDAVYAAQLEREKG